MVSDQFSGYPVTCRREFKWVREDQKRQLERFASILLASGAKQNLFSRRGNPQEVIASQIGSSLRSQFLVSTLRPNRILDLGSGGGFPGIPLAILNPCTDFTLLDSNARKARHLSLAVKELSLANAEVVCGRAEDLGRSHPPRARYDLVTAKAVSEPLAIAQLAEPLLGPRGAVLLYIGEDRTKGWVALLDTGGAGEGMVIRTVDAGTGEGERTRICLLGWGSANLGVSPRCHSRGRRGEVDSVVNHPEGAEGVSDGEGRPSSASRQFRDQRRDSHQSSR